MIKTFKTQFYPTASQRVYLAKAFGIRRFTWNWAVAKYFEQAKLKKYLSSFDLQKILNNSLVKDPAFSWLNEVNSMVRSEALKDFGLSIKAFYTPARHRAKRVCKKTKKIQLNKYKPHFQKKGVCKDSCRLMRKDDSTFKIVSCHVMTCTTIRKQPRFVIKTRESVEFLQDAKIATMTFSKQGTKYFVAVSYEKTNHIAKQTNTKTVGLDLGIEHIARGYDGTQTKILYDIPDSLFVAEKKTEHINKLLAKKVVGSKNHEKMRCRLANAYLHEANIKKDFREKFTTWLVENYQTIKLDDFSFAGASNLKRAARALHRVGVFAFKCRLETKAKERGCSVVYIPRGTPTTQTCSCCGHRPPKNIGLNVRTYRCKFCGAVIDRDLNAAINTYNYSVKLA